MVSGWRRTDEFGSDVVTFNIGPDAGIAGNAPDPVSAQLCRYDGRFALINAAFNIYEISFDQSQCAAATPTPTRRRRCARCSGSHS